MEVSLVKSIGVYHDSDTSLYHFNQLGNLGLYFDPENYFCTSLELDNFLTNNNPIKFAGFHVPFPEATDWLQRFHVVHQTVNHTFIFCSELHESTVNQIISLDLDNVSIFICGYINYNFKRAKIYQWMDWIVTTSYFYTVLHPDLLQKKLLPQKNKSKKFDILLGVQRTHRNFINNYVKEHPELEKQVIMTYFHRIDTPLHNNPNFIEETEGVTYLNDDKPTHSIHTVDYYGYELSLSQIIPINVYNQTYYTIVAETNFSNRFNFYTEKIVKPMLAGRLFVVFAGQHYLANLRRLGFKTFDSVIDESYDQIEDPIERWTAAIKQVEVLSQQNPSEILFKIKDVVEHNQRLLFNKDWYKEFSQCLAQEIVRTISG